MCFVNGQQIKTELCSTIMLSNKYLICKKLLIKEYVKTSQGQLLEMHLLESRLLDTFFKNVICSTQKVSTARQTKVCRTCTTFCFRADEKKVQLLEILSS